MSKDEKEKKLGNWCLEQIEFVLPETTFVSIYDWNSFSSFFFIFRDFAMSHRQKK